MSPADRPGMTHPFRILNTLVITVGLVVTGATGSARADEDDEREGVALGFDVGPNFVVVGDDVSEDSAGVGFAGRIGYRLALDLVDATPELKLGFESPGTPNAFRAMGGLRLGLGTLVSPVVFAHAGGLVGDLDGFVWDAGGGVRLNLGELSLGAEVSYNQVESQLLEFEGINDVTVEEQWEWVAANATLTVTL